MAHCGKSGACTESLFCGVKRAKGPVETAHLEKRHVPVLTAPSAAKESECFCVEVQAGKLLAHPNQRGHYVGFVELHADDMHLERADFTPVTTCPKARLCVQLDHVHVGRRAFASCNLYGVWEVTRP